MNIKRTLSAAVAVVMAAGTMGSLGITAFAATTVTTEEALRDAVAEGGEITLDKSIDLYDGSIAVDGKNVVLNLNGHEIGNYDFVDDWYTDCAIVVKNSGTLTINGTGGKVISQSADAIWKQGSSGAVTINGGTYIGSGWAGIESYGEKLTITDGSFSGGGDYGVTVGSTADIYSLTGEIYNNGTITFKGGTIDGSVTNDGGTLDIEADTIFRSIPDDLDGDPLAHPYPEIVESYDSTTKTLTISTINGNCAMKDYVDSTSAANAYTKSSWYNKRGEIKKIVIGEGVTKVGNYAFYTPKSGSDKYPDLKEIVISSSVTTIGEGAFSGLSALEEITIPEGVTSIEKNAFSACRYLEEITLPSTLTSLGNGAFSDCEQTEMRDNGSGISTPVAVGGLERADLSKTQLTSIADSTFSNCGWLKTVILPSTITSLGSNSFYNSASLEVINLEDTQVQSIGSNAFSATGATEIEFPDTLETIGSSAFSGASLETVVLPDSVTNIEGNAFINNTNLTSLTLSSNLETIGSNAFQSTGITSVEVPSSVTSVGSGAFKNCDSLRTVVIDEGVESIGSQAFADCLALESVTIPASVTSVESNAFTEDEDKDDSTQTTIIYKGSDPDVLDNIENAASGANTTVAKAEITAVAGDAIAMHEDGDPVGATGFVTTITNSGNAEGTASSVSWTVTSGGKSYVFTPSKFTTLTLAAEATATVALIVDGLYDSAATAVAGVY